MSGGLEFVAQVLSHTLHPDAATRESSEATLKRLESEPGYAASLLQIVVLPDNQIPIEIKQAAILRLKHNVKNYWDIKIFETRQNAEIELKTRNGEFSPSLPVANPLTIHDRSIIKENLFESIIHTPPIIRIQLLECVLLIARVDLPDDWPSLMPAIISGLSSGDFHRIYCSLLILLKVVHRWEFKEAKQRSDPIADIVQSTFPLLLQALKTVNSLNSLEAYEMSHVMCKIVYKAIHLSIPVNLRSSTEFMPWFNEISTTLNRQVPAQSLQQFDEKRKHPLWKAKKWCAHFMLSLFSRFGFEKEVKVPGNKVFARLWRGKCVKPAMSTLLSLLQSARSGEFVSPIVRYYSFEYLRLTLKLLDLRKLMQANLNWLIGECIINELSLTHEDIRLFINDPHEFIRQSNDLLEEFQDPRTPASRLLIDLCTLDAKRRNNEALKLTMATIVSAMDAPNKSPMNEQLILRKEGSMRMLMKLRPLVLEENQEALRAAVQPIIQNFVVPELSSQFGFMKSRALDVIGAYNELHWDDGEAHVGAITKVCSCLSSNESLPVRLAAIASVSRLIGNDEILDFVAPAVPALMDACFTLIDEVGNEEVVETMTVLFEKLGARIIPYVLALVTRFSSLILSLAAEDSSDDDSMLACSVAISTLATVINSLADRSEYDEEEGADIPVLNDEARHSMMLTLEPHLLAVISRVMNGENGEEPLYEFFEDVIMLVNSILYTDQRVTPALWPVLPRMIEAYLSEQPDMIQSLAAAIDCMTAHGGETFIANSVCLSLQHCQSQAVVPVSPLDHVLKLVSLILGRDNILTDEIIHKQYACRMLESVLAHHRGKVDFVIESFLPPLTQVLIDGGHKSNVVPLKLTVLDLLAGMTIYNPTLFLSTLAACGDEILRGVFNAWISYLNDKSMDSSEYHQRMAILGFASLSSLPFSSLPPVLTSVYHDLVTLQIQRLAKLKLLYDEMGQLEDGGYDPEDDDGLDFNDYKGNKWDDDNEEFEEDEENGGGDEFEEKSSMLPASMMNGEEPNEGEDRNWESLVQQMEQSHVDEAHYDSPLDELDPFVIFAQQLHGLQQREVDWYNKYINSVNNTKTVHDALTVVMAEAEERKRAEDEDAKEKAEKAAKKSAQLSERT